MTQYRTNNPLGSMAPRDLFDNAQNVDNWSNGEEPFYEDRFGVMRRSFSGMNFEFEAAQTGRQAAFDAQMEALGYASKGAYAAGVVLERYSEYVAVPGVVSGGTPAFYRPGPNAELPLTLEGDWTIDGPLLRQMDANDVLRQDLASENGAMLVRGAVASARTIAELRSIEPTYDQQQIELLGHSTYGVGGGLFYHDPASTADDDNGLTIVTASEKRWVRRKDWWKVSPDMFGAVGDGLTDDTHAVQKAINTPTIGEVELTRTYSVSQAVLRDNLTFSGSGKIISRDLASPTIYGNGVTGLKFHGSHFEGTGDVGTDLMRLENCNFVDIEGGSFKKAGGMGLRLNDCSRVTVAGVLFEGNYYYGMQDKGGIGNKVLGCRFYLNGDTGTNQSESTVGSPGGRGITWWGCTRNIIDDCSFEENTEYGFRLYSEEASPLVNSGHTITNLTFKDNGKRDFAISNTDNVNFKIKDCIIRGITIERTVLSPLHIDVFTLQGENVKAEDVVVINNTGTKADLLSVYNSRDCVLKDVRANNTTHIKFGSVASLTLDDVRLKGADRLIEKLSSNFVVKNCEATANAGASFALAMVDLGLTGIVIDGNKFKGFNIPIVTTVADAKFSMTNNITEDSVTYGWEPDTTNNHIGCVIHGNRFDKVRRTYHAGWVSDGVNNTIRFNSPPAQGTWLRGDTVWNTEPSSGGTPGWRCVAAGAPGTWKSMPSLAA